MVKRSAFTSLKKEVLSCTRTQDAGTMIIIVKHEPENLTDISTLHIILVGQIKQGTNPSF